MGSATRRHRLGSWRGGVVSPAADELRRTTLFRRMLAEACATLRENGAPCEELEELLREAES